jgi:hypothetical protein
VCDTTNDLRIYDERNTQQLVAQCEVILLVGKNNSHFLSIFYYADKRYKNELTDRIRKYLDDVIVFPTDGVTDFGSKLISLTYSDVGNQSPEFQDALKYLQKY